jgi:hypothetical protein
MKWDWYSFKRHFGLQAQNGSGDGGDGDGTAAAAAAAGYGMGSGMGHGVGPAGTSTTAPGTGYGTGTSTMGAGTANAGGFGGQSATGFSVGMGPGNASQGVSGVAGFGGGVGARGGVSTAGVSGGSARGGGPTGGGGGTAAGGSASGPASGPGSAAAKYGIHSINDLNNALAGLASFNNAAAWGQQMGTPMQNVAGATLGLEGSNYGFHTNALGGLSYGPSVSPALSSLSGAAPTSPVTVSALPASPAVSSLMLKGYTPAQIAALNSQLNTLYANELRGSANMGFPSAGLAVTPSGGYASSGAAPVGSTVGQATISYPSGPGMVASPRGVPGVPGVNNLSGLMGIRAAPPIRSPFSQMMADNISTQNVNTGAGGQAPLLGGIHK